MAQLPAVQGVRNADGLSSRGNSYFRGCRFLPLLQGIQDTNLSFLSKRALNYLFTPKFLYAKSKSSLYVNNVKVVFESVFKNHAPVSLGRNAFDV